MDLTQSGKHSDRGGPAPVLSSPLHPPGHDVLAPAFYTPAADRPTFSPKAGILQPLGMLDKVPLHLPDSLPSLFAASWQRPQGNPHLKELTIPQLRLALGQPFLRFFAALTPGRVAGLR